MPSFTGTYDHTVDGKGRLNIPTKIRDVLKEYGSDRLFLTILDDCIEAYPVDEWTKKEEKLRQLPSRDKEIKMFLRAQYSRAFDCTLDKSGRILIPPYLRNECEMNSKVTIIGVMDHFEIWPAEKWIDQCKNIDENMLSIEKKVADHGV